MSDAVEVDLRAARTALLERTPLVHCLTNTVAQTLTANALLAVGAAPGLRSSPKEERTLTPCGSGPAGKVQALGNVCSFRPLL